MRRHKRKLYIILITGLLLTAAFFFYLNKNLEESMVSFDTVETSERYIDIVFPTISFRAEVVEKEQDLERGFGGRELISKDEAMLFVFEKTGIHGIWMKDMLFPIDIVWLDENKEVVHIEHNVSPNSYPDVFYPPKSEQYVLEISAGLAQRYGITVGTAAEFEY